MGLTDLPGHDRKVTLDKKMIFYSHQRCEDGNRDYRRLFSVIFETTSKFPIVFLRLVFGKRGLTELPGTRREMDVRYEYDLKVILKVYGGHRNSCYRFWLNF